MARQVTFIEGINNTGIKTTYCLAKSCHLCIFRFKCFTEGELFVLTAEEIHEASITQVAGNKLLDLWHADWQKKFCRADIIEMTFREITKEEYFINDTDRARSLPNWERPKYMKFVPLKEFEVRK